MHRWIAALVWGMAGITVTATELTLASYNVENYTATSRMTESGYRKDYPKSEKSKAALRRVIKSMDADVLVLQEMGGRPYLTELQRDLMSEGVSYPHAFVVEAGDEVRHVALLSKQPLSNAQLPAM